MSDTDLSAEGAPAADSGTGLVDKAALRSAILQVVVAHSQPADLHKKWGFLTKTDFVRQLTVTPDELLTTLRNEFDDDQLRSSRVCVRREQAVALSPFFNDAGLKFFVHRKRDCSLFVDAHSDRASLIYRGPASIAWGNSRNELATPNQRELVFLAEKIDDLQVLAALGFTSVLSRGLDRLMPVELRMLFASDSLNDRFCEYRLVIADWDIADIVDVRQRRAHKSIKRLADAQRLYAIDPGRRFTIWQPGYTELSKLRAAVSFQDAKKVCEILEHGVPQPAHGRDWSYQVASNVPTITAARQKLQRAVARSDKVPHVADVSIALEEYVGVFERAIPRKLCKAADAASAPIDAFCNLAAAELARNWLNGQAPVEAAKAILAGKHPSAASANDSDRFLEQLKIFDRLHKLARTLLPRK